MPHKMAMKRMYLKAHPNAKMPYYRGTIAILSALTKYPIYREKSCCNSHFKEKNNGV